VGVSFSLLTVFTQAPLADSVDISEIYPSFSSRLEVVLLFFFFLEGCAVFFVFVFFGFFFFFFCCVFFFRQPIWVLRVFSFFSSI